MTKAELGKQRGAVVLPKEPYRRTDGKNVGRHVPHVVRKASAGRVCHGCNQRMLYGRLYASYLGDGLCLDCVDPTNLGTEPIRRVSN